MKLTEAGRGDGLAVGERAVKQQAVPQQVTKEQATEARQFLLRDYDAKIRYISDHFNRTWTRFNYFLVLEAGLSAALWVWFKDKGVFISTASALAWVGAVTSLLWYMLGAQDRHLVEVYRGHVRDAGNKIAELLGLQDYLGSSYVYVGDPDTKVEQEWYEYVYQWRTKLFSSTKMVAWFPLIALIYWISMIFLTAK